MTCHRATTACHLKKEAVIITNVIIINIIIIIIIVDIFKNVLYLRCGNYNASIRKTLHLPFPFFFVVTTF